MTAIASTTVKEGVGAWPIYTDLGMNFAGRYMVGGVPKSFSDFTFSRASAGEVILGGSRLTFASGIPRIVNGAIYRDSVGATNVLSNPEDHTTGWTNDRVTVGAVTTFGGGTVPFYPLMETATSGSHDHRRTHSSTASDVGMVAFVRGGLGRANVEMVLFTESANGFRGRFTLSGAGTVIQAAGIGASPATNVVGRITALADDVYLIAVYGTLAADGHTTIRPYLSGLNDAGTSGSYAGDPAKGFYAGPVMLNLSRDIVDYTASTRAAESLSVPLDDGPWSFRVRDTLGNDEWRGMVTVSGGSYDLVPVAGSTTLTKVEGYQLDYMHDFSGDADTSDGDIGSGWDLRGGSETLPLPTATKGRISGGKVVADQGDVLYATRVFASPVHHMETSVSWQSTGGGGAPSTFAMFANSDVNLIQTTPHHTLDRNQMFIGQISAGSITVLSTYNFSPNPDEAGTQVQFRHSTDGGDGTVVESIRNSERQTYQAAQFADGGLTPVGTRGIWEIYQPDVAASNTLSIHKVGARYRPVLLAA